MTALSRPGVRIAAFAVGLAAAFGLLFGIGRAVGPWDAEPTPGQLPAGNHDVVNHGMSHSGRAQTDAPQHEGMQ